MDTVELKLFFLFLKIQKTENVAKYALNTSTVTVPSAGRLTNGHANVPSIPSVRN